MIVPSLHALLALWQRDHAAEQPLARGLLLAVSEFGERHPDLPAVEREAASVMNYFTDGRSLLSANATWPALLELVNKDGLAGFSCWHIATHAHHDPLSGLALYDRDIWLDALWDLALLPPPIVLSACSGVQSLVFTGDEQTGLAATCLAAGAAQIIDSLWGIPDEDAARFMADFYARLAARCVCAGANAARLVA